MSNTTIPKVIHYCWFGGQEKPKKVLECIDSWKRVMPDYQFMEWNEESFNIKNSKNDYVIKAYQLKKFAFVSDYVRLKALLDYGGIYLDTDVEVLKPFDEFLDNETFWGFELGNYVATSTIGSQKNHKIIKKFIKEYEKFSPLNNDAKFDMTTNVIKVTKIFEGFGLILNGKYQKIDGIGEVYPKDFFSPYDYINLNLKITDRTVAIHHFLKSWSSKKEKLRYFIKKIIVLLTSPTFLRKIRRF